MNLTLIFKLFHRLAFINPQQRAPGLRQEQPAWKSNTLLSCISSYLFHHFGWAFGEHLSLIWFGNPSHARVLQGTSGLLHIEFLRSFARNLCQMNPRAPLSLVWNLRGDFQKTEPHLAQRNLTQNRPPGFGSKLVKIPFCLIGMSLK